MVLKTSYDCLGYFLVEVDGQLIYRLSRLPPSFVLELPGSESYILTKGDQNFLGLRKFILANVNRECVAEISGLLGNQLKFGGNSYSIKTNTRRLSIESLPIEVTMTLGSFKSILTSKIDLQNQQLLPIAALLHFTTLHRLH